jgi:hypothetical protein
MHLYLTHLFQKIYSRLKIFTTKSKFKIKVTRSSLGLFIRYQYVKYQNPIPHDSQDIAQIKVFSLRCDAVADTGVVPTLG